MRSLRMRWGIGAFFSVITLLAGHAHARTVSDKLQIRAKVHAAAASNDNLPVVIWHGMGDSCCSPDSTGSVKKYLEDKLGVFVYSIATGDTEAADVWSTYFGDVNLQVAKACDAIRVIPQLQGGYNAIGFSQGGQFLRAMIQRCQHLGPKAKLLVTLGSQHQGIMNVPGCGYADSQASKSLKGSACRAMEALISKGAYLPLIQSHVVQAQYFKEPNHLDEYLKHGIFLPDVNNEREVKNQQYKMNLLSLEKFVMFRFSEDKMVVPRDSSWFSFFNGTQLVPMRDQAMYKEDWLGLQELDSSGRLVFSEAPGPHMHFSFAWFLQEIVEKYLGTVV